MPTPWLYLTQMDWSAIIIMSIFTMLWCWHLNLYHPMPFINIVELRLEHGWLHLRLSLSYNNSSMSWHQQSYHYTAIEIMTRTTRLCPVLEGFVVTGTRSPNPKAVRQNEHDGISDHQPHNCLHNRLFRRRSKKTSKLRVTGLCGEFISDRCIPHTKGQ